MYGKRKVRGTLLGGGCGGSPRVVVGVCPACGKPVYQNDVWPYVGHEGKFYHLVCAADVEELRPFVALFRSALDALIEALDRRLGD